ncbi:MAG: spondin domain-containing protein [Thiotrichales bacterium]
MKKRFLAGLIAAVTTTPLMAAELDITITNLTHGNHFTPLLVAAHGNSTHLFQSGTAASAHLQAMAEGGDISGLVTDVDAAGGNKVENPAAGLLAPGASTMFSLSTTDGNDYLSTVAMVLPTNDGFVGLDSLKIPTTPGVYHYTLNAYDAGTEANDEIVNGGGAPGTPGIPADPLGKNGTGATGVTTAENNTTVHIHRGVLGDSNPNGGISDLDSSVHRWLNPVAMLVITVK